MKKKLITFLTIAALSHSYGQAWSEDFSSCTIPGLPSGWVEVNLDGLTVNSQLNSFNFGNKAWVSLTHNNPAYAKCIVSTSWYSNPGTSNDWVITPSFSVPANAVLKWDAFAGDATYADGYNVMLSTTGTNVANFTTNLLSVSAENATWTTRSVNLNAFAGQVVNIAFVNNSNDMLFLVLDNISVLVPSMNDGKVAGISGLTRYMAGAGGQNISGTFESEGYSPANNAVLNYNVNNGPVVTQVMNFPTPLGYGQTSNFSFSTPANLSLGTNKIKVWVTQVNNVNEINTTNDTAYTYVYVASTTKPRKALMEEWTSSTCAPCAQLNVTNGFDALINNNNPNKGGNFCVVKYQMNWPNPGNDPSYNDHGYARRAHYNVTGIPYAVLNGRTEMTNHTQAEIDAAIADSAFADITATLSAKGSTNAAANTTISASATITPYVTILNNSPLRVFQVIMQSSYTYTSAATIQKEYHHVMRKMNPNGWGTPTVVTDGTPFVVNFSHLAPSAPIDPTPAQLSFNSWTTNTLTPKDIVYEYVVFLQDTVSNHILQTASWTASVAVPTNTTSSVGIHEHSSVGQISVYPNPAKEYAVVSIEIEKSSLVEISIFNMEGKQVYTNKSTTLNGGKHDLKINTSEFATGNYSIRLNLNGEILNEKLVVTK